MELLIQTMMESMQEGTIPFAYLLFLIWSFEHPLVITGFKHSYSPKSIFVPLNKKATTDLQAIEATCSRMFFGKMVKRKVCPDDEDNAHLSFSFSNQWI